ncbi:MAG TPA: hypothetical protein VGD14_16840, partial [bacterium]
CDLPYPLDCGLWFDHHDGNLQELQYRSIELDAIAGKFDLQPSCARVILNYFLEKKHRFPDYFLQLVDETDIIDSFDYHSVEDWRKETPAKIIDATIRSRIGDIHEKRTYLRNLVFWLRDNPIGDVVTKGEIQSRYQDYSNEEQEMMNLIKDNSYFLSIDTEKQIVILDFTNFNRPGFVIKNLAYLLYPQSLAVLEVKNLFNRGIKSNDLAFSLSLSINLNQENHAKDVSEIMRELNIGDGHKGAAAGKLTCNSKDEMLRQKQFTLDRIFKIWQEQV